LSGLTGQLQDQTVAESVHKADPYEFTTVDVPTLSRLQDVFDLACENWRIRVEKNKIKISQSIKFKVYSEISLVNNAPDVSKKIAELEVYGRKTATEGFLVVHIDCRALYGCMIRKFVWNGVLGSLCMYEREPNRHFPADVFSLNYLSLSDAQISRYE
jgi:hypothetical protein